MQLTERCWLSKEKPQAGKPRHPEAQSVKEVGSFFFKTDDQDGILKTDNVYLRRGHLFETESFLPINYVID